MAEFVLDPRIEADSVFVAALPLSDLRLMRDARYPWLLLVPRAAGLVELTDLDAPARGLLVEEIALASQALRTVAPCDKLNVGALGNQVRQLHVHIVARRIGDDAWPGPVWGRHPTLPYAESALEARIAALREALSSPAAAS
jgi:diadenosine tetraphosphate (Ap4A) HIT family hydrolase